MLELLQLMALMHQDLLVLFQEDTLLVAEEEEIGPAPDPRRPAV
jgi:hypothetical protein